MSKPVAAVIVFVVSTLIVLGILQFVLHLQGAITKLVIGIVVGLVLGGIAFLVVKEPVKG